ncbi:MAG: L,D-transpeptidase family protein [Alphaproteobacteria bacterium]|nr:L,D-transpeptidase family protein [Alphaproteobacteria bacterium]MDE1930372.1 L,D-transpeptidase family protein [Alphaproteobacteria bacterium]
MDLLVEPAGWVRWGTQRLRCALGKSGVRPIKREGDGATPAGAFVMRRLLYRPDRGAAPATRLPMAPIAADDGWCDDPADAAYNRPVKLPYQARAERLWRADRLYDLVVVLGYNDDPAIAGAGSAIFLHVASAGYAPTEGCVALAPEDLRRVLAEADASSRVVVAAP